MFEKKNVHWSLISISFAQHWLESIAGQYLPLFLCASKLIPILHKISSLEEKHAWQRKINKTFDQPTKTCSNVTFLSRLKICVGENESYLTVVKQKCLVPLAINRKKCVNLKALLHRTTYTLIHTPGFSCAWVHVYVCMKQGFTFRRQTKAKFSEVSFTTKRQQARQL